jgi:hypothetical protein
MHVRKSLPNNDDEQSKSSNYQSVRTKLKLNTNFIANLVKIYIHKRFVSAATCANCATCAMSILVVAVANVAVQRYSDVRGSSFAKNVPLLSRVCLTRNSLLLVKALTP